MALFNIGIDFESEEAAKLLYNGIMVQAYFTQELELHGERVSFVGQQNRIDELVEYAKSVGETICIEYWPYGTDYDEADGSGELFWLDVYGKKT